MLLFIGLSELGSVLFSIHVDLKIVVHSSHNKLISNCKHFLALYYNDQH